MLCVFVDGSIVLNNSMVVTAVCCSNVVRYAIVRKQEKIEGNFCYILFFGLMSLSSALS